MEEYKIGIADALFSLRNGAEWTVHSDDTIEWLSNDFVQPTDVEIQPEITRLQTEYDNNKYQTDRNPMYGTWEEQWDMMYHGTWKAHVDKIKSDIPKE